MDQPTDPICIVCGNSYQHAPVGQALLICAACDAKAGPKNAAELGAFSNCGFSSLRREKRYIGADERPRVWGHRGRVWKHVGGANSMEIIQRADEAQAVASVQFDLPEGWGAGLNPRHRAFVQAYFASRLNSSAASRLAGYSDHREGWRLLQKDAVATCVTALMPLYLEKLGQADYRADLLSRQHQCVVYFVQGGEMVKIGISRKLPQRLMVLRNASPVPLVLLGTIPGDAVLESQWHNRFAHCRSHGEWFRLTPELGQAISQVLGGGA